MNHFARAVVAEKRAAGCTLVYYVIDADMSRPHQHYIIITQI